MQPQPVQFSQSIHPGVVRILCIRMQIPDQRTHGVPVDTGPRICCVDIADQKTNCQHRPNHLPLGRLSCLFCAWRLLHRIRCSTSVRCVPDCLGSPGQNRRPLGNCPSAQSCCPPHRGCCCWRLACFRVNSSTHPIVYLVVSFLYRADVS